MKAFCFTIVAISGMELFAAMAGAQLLPSQAKGAARAQIVMLRSDGAYGAGIIVGYDDKLVYVATAAHIADLTKEPFPKVTVKFEDLAPARQGQFSPEHEARDAGDLAIVTVARDPDINKFLDDLDFALLSPVALGPADSPVTSVGYNGGAEWSNGTNETLLPTTDGYLRFQSDVNGGQSGGGLFNESWELIGMPLDVGDNGVYARPIAQLLEDLRKWGVPIRLASRPIKDRARGADEIAQERERESKARELAAISTEGLSEDPEKSILLGMQAVNATLRFGQPPVPAAEDALHQAILSSPVRLTLRGHSDVVFAVAFSPDGKRLATASADQTVKVWDSESGKELLTLRGTATAVAFSPDGKLLATASGKTAKVWKAEDGKELLTLRGHSDVVCGVAFSPDGKRLATASFDRTAKVWDTESGKALLTLRGHSSGVDRVFLIPVNGVAFSPDGKRLATASDDETAKVWDAESGKELLTLRGHSSGVDAVAFSPDGKLLATASGDETAKVWDAESGKELLTLRGHSSFLKGVVFSPDGKRLATASGDETAKVWDAKSGKELLTLRGHSAPGHSGSVLGVAFSPDGNRLATASWDHTAKVWESGKELLTLRGRLDVVYRVAFSPDGKRLATASGDRPVTCGDAPCGSGLQADQTAKVWDAESGKELLTLRDSGSVLGVAFSPDGKLLATAGLDHTAKVWDAESGKELLTLRGHSRDVLGVAFSPDGKRLATASWDATAKVWDAESGKELLTLRGHSKPVTAWPSAPMASASPPRVGTRRRRCGTRRAARNC